MNLMKKIRDIFRAYEAREIEPMDWMLSKPTAANLAQLKRKDIGLFYTLDDSLMELHLLLGKGSELEFSVDDTQIAWLPISDAGDKTERVKRLNAWCCDIKSFMRDYVKPREHAVLIAGRTLKDAIYLFYDRSFETPLLASELSVYGSMKEALYAKVAKSKNCRKVNNVHVILTKCPELTEVLRIARGYTPEQGTTYDYDCGCFFIDEELSDMLKACEDFCHAASVADGEPENKVFPTPGGVG